MKHLEDTLETYVQCIAYYNMCNIRIYFCNILMKHLQYTSKTSETFEMFESLDKCPRCGVSRYKNNDLYGGDEASIGKKRNKKSTKRWYKNLCP